MWEFKVSKRVITTVLSIVLITYSVLGIKNPGAFNVSGVIISNEVMILLGVLGILGLAGISIFSILKLKWEFEEETLKQ